MADEKRLLTVELLTKNNAEAISSLAVTVDKLTKVLQKTDNDILETVKQLEQSSILCNERHRQFMNELSKKKELMEYIHSEVSGKASTKEVDKLYKILWAVIGGIFAGLGSILVYIIKNQLH